ncbi:unnamed protein product [Camellia sinensis]
MVGLDITIKVCLVVSYGACGTIPLLIVNAENEIVLQQIMEGEWFVVRLWIGCAATLFSVSNFSSYSRDQETSLCTWVSTQKMK